MEEIRKLLNSEKFLIGTETNMKALKRGGLAKIYLSSNTDSKTRKDVEYYKNISDVKIIELKLTNTELGTLCRKPFPVSIAGVLK